MRGFPRGRGAGRGAARSGAAYRAATALCLLGLAAAGVATALRAGAPPRNDPPPRSGLPASFTAGPPFRLYPSAVTQTEPFIARHPLNDSILFVAANTINLATGFISEGVYASRDRGISWRGSDTCAGAPIQFHRGDPGIAIDDDGAFVLTRLGFSPGLYAHSSTDDGLTWSAQKQVASNDQDRADVASDDDPASPGFGAVHAAWVRLAPPYPVMISTTTDGGGSWSAPLQVNAPVQRSVGAVLAAGRGGLLYACWAGVTSSSPFTEDFGGFARSTDGGASWTAVENAFDMNGIAGTLPQKAGIRVNGQPRIAVDRSGGPRDGRIYVVTTERNLAPAGADPDIIVRWSADSGRTWSARTRVNQDASGNGKTQYFPAIHVDRRGGVNVLYYSDEGTTADSAGIWLARSVDGGLGWEAAEIGGHRFLPQPIGGLGAGYQGDNIALCSVGDTLIPVWTDNSTGLYQLWTSAVTIPADPTKVGERGTAPRGYALEQNFPNPFNPSTTIRFTLPRAEQVELAVFDLQGRRVATLISGRLPAGIHEAGYSPGAGSSGVFIARLVTPSVSIARRMLHLK